MKKLILIFLMCSSVRAWALIEARLHYGLVSSKPDLGGAYTGPSSVPTTPPVYGLGGDVIVNLPMVPFGLGLRYEDMAFKASTSDLKFNSQYQRTALLINHRLIDTLIYLGPLATIGLIHSGGLKIEETGTKVHDYATSKGSSWSVGLEAGIHLVGLVIGAEIGYQSMKLEGAKDSGTAQAATREFDFSGSYGKMSVGFGF